MKLLPTRCFAAGWLAVTASVALSIHNAAAQSSSDQPSPQTTSVASTRPPQAKFLTEARTYLDLESFDLADKRYRQVLALDPDNATALHGRTEVKDRRARFEQDVADGRRSRTNTVKIPTEQNALDAATIARKLQSITIPLFDVREVTLNDALEQLRQDARTYDSDPTEEERGLNIFLKLPQPTARDPGIPGLPPGAEGPSSDRASSPVPSAGPVITLRLENVSLLQALTQTAERAGLKVKVEPYAVSLIPFVESTEDLVTLVIRVPQTFLGIKAEPSSPTDDGTGGSGPLSTRNDAKTFLESCGVTFPPGSAAVYLVLTQKLVVRNTRSNLDLVQILCDEFTKSH